MTLIGFKFALKTVIFLIESTAIRSKPIFEYFTETFGYIQIKIRNILNKNLLRWWFTIKYCLTEVIKL